MYLNKIFLYLVVLKLIIAAMFTSELSNELFLPFVTTYYHNFSNPWQYYAENSLNLNAFPYHSLMLYILTPFAFLGDFFDCKFLFKIPLLLADLSILYFFRKFFPMKEKQVIFYYFMNPIILYAIYIHSQLDIIPMAFLIACIYFMSREKIIFSALFVGFALATKLHILIVLPLISFYLLKKYTLSTVVRYLLVSLGTFFVLDLPFIFSTGFIDMVFMNPKQSLLFDSYYKIGELEFLLPISSITMVYLHFFNQRKVNLDLLFFYFGILFTATIFFIYPAPAWYVWLVPFIAIYFIQNDNIKSKILYYGLSLIYVIFFIFFYHSEYKDILFLGHEVNLKISNNRLINTVFTFLESMLLAIMYAFYKYGIKSNTIYKKKLNLTIGIGGDSGVGKSSLLSNLKLLLGARLLQIEGDGEHKWERGDKNWLKYTHLDPKANYIHKQADAIYELKQNHSIFRSEYDHDTGKFTKLLKIEPKEFIAISGLHPFYLPKLRKIIDLKIYLDTDENLRRYWKITRDTKERGYSLEKIIQQMEARKEDTQKYIYPQKIFADLVIRFFAINESDFANLSQKVSLGLKITLDASIRVEELLELIETEYGWDYNEDLRTQYVEFTTEPMSDYEAIALKLIPNLYEIIVVEPIWQNGYQGFIQLITLMMISEKLKEVKL